MYLLVLSMAMISEIHLILIRELWIEQLIKIKLTDIRKKRSNEKCYGFGSVHIHSCIKRNYIVFLINFG